MGKNSVTVNTPDMGLMTVTRRPHGADVRHEASGQVQRHADFNDAVNTVKHGTGYSGPTPAPTEEKGLGMMSMRTK